MKLRNKRTGEVGQIGYVATNDGAIIVEDISGSEYPFSVISNYKTLTKLNEDWEDYKPAEPLIKDEKIRKAVRAWAEAENCTREMNLYYTLNRQEKYITFHNPQTGSELQLCDFDSPVFQEIREYTIAELCGEEEE